MNLNERFPVSPQKLEALIKRMTALNIQAQLIEESFSRGTGKGGQKINKTSNAVTLRYPPLDISVKVHRERQRSLNRFLALRELVDQIEMQLSPQTSARRQEWQRIRKQKERNNRRRSAHV